MTAKELKEILTQVPDEWEIVVEPEYNENKLILYKTAGARGFEVEKKLIIEQL